MAVKVGPLWIQPRNVDLIGDAEYKEFRLRGSRSLDRGPPVHRRFPEIEITFSEIKYS